MHDLAQVTRLSYTHASKYCYWLHQAGYITRHGRRDSATLWRATAKAKQQQAAPIPVRTPKDPFNAERNAACRLVRCLMDADLYQPSTRQRIIRETQIILRRFAPDGRCV
jgi:hypothetical protein